MEDLAGGPMLRPPGIAPARTVRNEEPGEQGPGALAAECQAWPLSEAVFVCHIGNLDEMPTSLHPHGKLARRTSLGTTYESVGSCWVCWRPVLPPLWPAALTVGRQTGRVNALRCLNVRETGTTRLRPRSSPAPRTGPRSHEMIFMLTIGKNFFFLLECFVSRENE